jgi:hypothetical protein
VGAVLKEQISVSTIQVVSLTVSALAFIISMFTLGMFVRLSNHLMKTQEYLTQTVLITSTLSQQDILLADLIKNLQKFRCDEEDRLFYFLDPKNINTKDRVTLGLKKYEYFR